MLARRSRPAAKVTRIKKASTSTGIICVLRFNKTTKTWSNLQRMCSALQTLPANRQWPRHHQLQRQSLPLWIWQVSCCRASLLYQRLQQPYFCNLLSCFPGCCRPVGGHEQHTGCGDRAAAIGRRCNATASTAPPNRIPRSKPRLGSIPYCRPPEAVQGWWVVCCPSFPALQNVCEELSCVSGLMPSCIV